MNYIIHQSNMPKQTSKNVSHDQKNPTRGDNWMRRRVWILVWAHSNWAHQLKQGKFLNLKLMCFMV